MNEFGFLVAACLRTYTHVYSLYECLASIQKFHPEVPIVVVLDFTSEETFVDDVIIQFPSVRFETNTPKVPADMLLHYYFRKNHYFQKGILLQDSMELILKVDISKTSKLDYLWHFTNHRVHWHTIEEPKTEFNKEHNIITHDDLVKYCINTFIKKEDCKQYCQEMYDQKEKWSGCFGCLCIIEYDTLCEFDEKTGILNVMLEMKDNRLRRAIESLFSLACQFYLKKEIHTSYDGLYYDGTYHNNFTGTCIKKKSFNRQ